MGRIAVDKDKCKGCLLCASVCPKEAIITDSGLNKMGIKAVKPKEGADCSGCAMCALICPECCITVYK
ncbi:MAG: (Fe-S)-binding protein [Candidatus Omnitrophica bacterium]|nr:(Fe-S)-binding protein [Candidatus Omnitrophota bacterium]